VNGILAERFVRKENLSTGDWLESLKATTKVFFGREEEHDLLFPELPSCLHTKEARNSGSSDFPVGENPR